MEGRVGGRRRAGALHLGGDLFVRSLELQVAAAAAAVVHRMPWCLRHLSNGETFTFALYSCVWVCEGDDEAQGQARAQVEARAAGTACDACGEGQAQTLVVEGDGGGGGGDGGNCTAKAP